METGLGASGDAITWQILGRHARADDLGAEQMSADNPFGVVRYVCTRRALPGDTADALVLVGLLRDGLDRAELTLLLGGHREGLTWQDLADVLGLHSRQAARQRARRLDAALAARRLDAELAALSPEAGAGHAVTSGGGLGARKMRETRWLEEHEAAIRG